MTIKKLFPLFIVIVFAGSAFPQFNPYSFYLPKDKRIAKPAANPTISSSNVSDIITIGDTIWVGTGQGLSLSTDNGATWTNFTNDKTFGTESVSAIGYDHGVFWAATAHSVNKDNQSLPEGSGLKYTTDNGKTWTSIPEPLDQESDSIVVYGINHLRALPVTVAVNNIVYDIAFTPGTVWIATFAGGLRKSTDMGKTWQRVVLPPDYLNTVKPTDTLDFCMQPVSGNFCGENNLNYRVFSVISTNDSTLYVGTADGINKSTDNGISWQKFTHTNQANAISGNFVVALGYNPSDHKVWGATWQAEGQTEFYGVSYSSDGGQNWQTSLSGEKVHNFAFNGNQIVAPSDDGAFGTADNGADWVLPATITDAVSGVSIVSPVFYCAGFSNGYTWLGNDDGLGRLEPNNASMWSGKWSVYFASQPLSSASDTFAYPNPFNPRTDILKIKYSTNGGNVPVTIRIYDFGMHYIRTITQNAERGSVHAIDQSGGVVDYWDGRDDSGNIVPNGVYFYRVDAGSDKPVFGKIIVLQ